MALGRLSLVEQIAQLEEAAPVDYDPEDLQSRGGEVDDELLDDGSAGREHYLQVGLSSLRNALPSVADPKYEGIRTSRKQLLEDSEAEVSDDSEEEDDRVREADEGSLGAAEESMDDDHVSDENSESEESGGAPEEEQSRIQEFSPNATRKSPGPSEDINSAMKKAREEDLRKGKAVKKQISLWDTLLDTRIRLQKSIVSANGLPLPSEIKPYLEVSDCHDALSKFLTAAHLLMDELCELQEKMLATNNIISPPPRKRRKLDAEATLEEHLVSSLDATKDVVTLEAAFHPYLVQTLSKWSTKIQAVAPSALLPSNRGAFLKGNQGLKSVVQLIDEILADSSKLLVRTQVARVKKRRIGEILDEESKPAESLDANTFDDTDFYQKMLRDIIDARGNGGSEDDWMLLQKQKKAKKKVDTKASKGRKLRYEVHEKIQNFMVPVPIPGAWHDEQADELFASLFGKGFEDSDVSLHPLAANEPQVQEIFQSSEFRVF